MAAIAPTALFRQLTSGKFGTSYYFCGSEDYRIAEAEKFVAQSFLSEKQLSTNSRRIDGRKTKIDDLVAELSVYPMLGERQVFIVTDFQSYKPTEVDRVLKLLSPPDPNRIVVFSSPASRMPRKNAAFYKKMLSKTDAVVEFARLTGKQAAQTIGKRFQEQGYSIDKEALESLVDLVAGNRGALDAEADKLMQFKADDHTITTADVRRVGSGFVVYSIFELADAIVDRNRHRVLHMLDQLLSSSDISGTVLYHLGQHFIFLYLLRSGKQLPGNRGWLAGRLRSQADRFAVEELERILKEIAETTSRIRREGVDARLALEMLALSLMEEAA